MGKGDKLNWLGWAMTGKEFIAMSDLARFGIDHWRGVRIEFERRGNQRTAEGHEYPALLNYIWLNPTIKQVPMLSKVRYLGSTFHQLGPHIIKQCSAFHSEVEQKEAEARDLIAERERILVDAKTRADTKEQGEAALGKRMAAYRTSIASYTDGAQIEIRDGALAGEIATFRRLVQTAHDLFPRLQADIMMMGQLVPVELDPLDVRRAV